MTSASLLNPSPDALGPLQHARPLSSITASAKRITSETMPRRGTSKTGEAWQEDAWNMYDLVGEQHFLANTLAGRLSQAKFFIGQLPDDPTDDIKPLDSGPAVDVFTSLVGSGPAFSQMTLRIGLNLLVAAECYLVGVLPAADEEIDQAERADGFDSITPIGLETDGRIDLDALEWSVHSVSEIEWDNDGNLKVQRPGQTGQSKYPLDDIFVIRVWRSHPRRWVEADCATRAALPILRELVGLTMHISAQIDSRLAGAGLLLVPASADAAVRAAVGASLEDASPFTEALLDAMITPISDRSSASAVVPLVSVVPDDSIEKFRHLTFATPLDAETRNLRDEAIRRLALSQDCPPEVLLGMASMNHWGAWLVREDVVTTHLEPPLALISDALTTQFLWPILEQQGVADFKSYVVWFDVDHLIIRPDRSSNAKDLHSAGVISDDALRDASGFDATDAPAAREALDPAVTIALDLVKEAPSLAQDPGLGALVRQIQMVLAGEIEEEPEPVEPEPAPTPLVEPEPEDETPDSSDADDRAGPPEGGPPLSAGAAEMVDLGWGAVIR